jgi:hypothetical protein
MMIISRGDGGGKRKEEYLSTCYLRKHLSLGVTKQLLIVKAGVSPVTMGKMMMQSQILKESTASMLIKQPKSRWNERRRRRNESSTTNDNGRIDSVASSMMLWGCILLHQPR